MINDWKKLGSEEIGVRSFIITFSFCFQGL
jgi:hypothetical protein